MENPTGEDRRLMEPEDRTIKEGLLPFYQDHALATLLPFWKGHWTNSMVESTHALTTRAKRSSAETSIPGPRGGSCGCGRDFHGWHPKAICLAIREGI